MCSEKYIHENKQIAGEEKYIWVLTSVRPVSPLLPGNNTQAPTEIGYFLLVAFFSFLLKTFFDKSRVCIGCGRWRRVKKWIYVVGDRPAYWGPSSFFPSAQGWRKNMIVALTEMFRLTIFTQNIATGEMSRAFTPFHFFGYFNRFGFHHKKTCYVIIK